MSALLRLAELLYQGINRVRRALYGAGVLKSHRLPRPVISVGNLGTGGAGKTPAVIAVCRFLESRSVRVAVLSRGYGRDDLSHSGKVTDFDADKFGDEPVLIKRNINGDVIVGAKRYRNAIHYLRDNNCEVFVLDDGFQHLQLRRDFDLIVDAPSRFHREDRGALRHAHAVIPRRLRLSIPSSLRGRRVFAFSGLAHNEQFFDALRAEGLTVVGTKGFRDHHRYTSDDLAAIRREAGEATIVTTGKDAVKIDDPEIVALEPQFVIDDGVLETMLLVARGESPR